MRDERDVEAETIASLINELGFEVDADGVPVAAHVNLDDGDLTWTAERAPVGAPRPSLDEWTSRHAPKI